MKSARYYSQILVKLEVSGHSFEKNSSNIEFNANLSIGSLDV